MGENMIQREIEKGYGTVTKEAMQDRQLTIEAKAIYAYLCSYAGGKDEAYPSQSKMCHDLNIDVKRLKKHMQLLIDNEYVRIDKYRYTNGNFANNRYVITR